MNTNVSQLVSLKLKLSGWWFFATPLKNVKVSWDDYSHYMETYYMFQTTKQFFVKRKKMMCFRGPSILTYAHSIPLLLQYVMQLIDRSVLPSSNDVLKSSKPLHPYGDGLSLFQVDSLQVGPCIYKKQPCKQRKQHVLSPTIEDFI